MPDQRRIVDARHAVADSLRTGFERVPDRLGTDRLTGMQADPDTTFASMADGRLVQHGRVANLLAAQPKPDQSVAMVLRRPACQRHDVLCWAAADGVEDELHPDAEIGQR